MIIDFRLKVFHTVALQLSFTAAARLLYISQPAVTKHIRELEKQTQKPLFHRKGSQISLTQEGMLLLAYSKKIIALYEDLDNARDALQNIISGQIKIGASTTLAQYILPSVLAKFRRQYSDIKVALQNANTEIIEQYVAEEKVDIGIIEGAARNPLLHYAPFVQDEIVLVTRIGNKKITAVAIPTAHITTLPLILREDGSGTKAVVLSALATKGLQKRDLNIEMELGSTESVKRYLYASDAFAFLSIHTILQELSSGTLKVVELLDLDINRIFQFVTRHGDYSPLLSRFRQFCLLHYNQTE